MSTPVLAVSGLGKAFRQYGSELKRFATWFGASFKPSQESWVLRNVAFEIAPGEAVGIVGQNGAGKSTLLKLITGTLHPTEGTIQVNGRVSAILELGMGFNPELSGRQNVYLASGLQGYSKKEIDAVIDQVEEFTELGEYFDKPTRVYSSGMQARLAFSVATMYRPELLIVDEVLSVGDAYFQHKSFDRIRKFRDLGTTILIVSHDKAAVQSLCNRAILLEQGELVKKGDPESVMDYYNAIIAEKENSKVTVIDQQNGKKQTISGTGEACVERIGLYNKNDELVECINVGESVELRIEVRINKSIPRLVLGYLIKDRLGQEVYGTNTHYTGQGVEIMGEGERLEYRIRFEANIGPGNYSISTALVSTNTHMEDNYEWKDLALIFNVQNNNKHTFAGVAWIPPLIKVERK